MKNRRTLRISLFWGYLSFYALIAILAMLLLGALLNGIYLRNINKNLLDNTQRRVEHVCDDLDAQMEGMSTLSLKLRVQRMYQKDYFTQNKYREIELLESLSQYSSYSGLSSEFVLVYPNKNSAPDVFSSFGSKTDYSVFLRRHELQESSVSDLIFSETSGKPRYLTCNDSLLVAFDITAGVSHEKQSNGILLFVIPTSAIAERVRLVGDLLPDTYDLYLDGIPVISGSVSPEVILTSKEGFRIETAIARQGISDILIRPSDYRLFGLAIIALIILTLVFAYFCYKPIRALVLRYSSEHGKRKNEIAVLDLTLEQFQNKTHTLSSQTATRTSLLRNYMLLMLLNNYKSASFTQDLEKAGISLEGPFFFVITITPCQGQTVSSENIQTMASSLGDIGEDIGEMYAVECDHHNHMLAVLCQVGNEADRGILLSRIQSYLNAQTLRFLIGEGPTVSSVSSIPTSYLSAASQLDSIEGAVVSASGASTGTAEISSISRMIDCIESGSCEEALILLDECMDGIDSENASEVAKRTALFGVNSAIYQTVGKFGFNLTESQLASLMSVNDVRSTHFILMKMIPLLCAHINAQKRKNVVPTYQLVLDYLDAHYADWDISAKQVSEAVGIGINRVNSIVREKTGSNCKSYITKLRLKKACQLLADTDKPVFEIAEQVGYSSASYFIRVFKESLGETPESYRKTTQS